MPECYVWDDKRPMGVQQFQISKYMKNGSSAAWIGTIMPSKMSVIVALLSLHFIRVMA